MMMLEETNGQQMPSIHPNNFGLFTAGNFDPCHVCGEASSGWHCGAITCEACKKFFLRSINGEDSKYKCVRNRDCNISRNTRTQCQFCRFQKCLKVGMTTNGKNPNNPTVAELFKAFPCNVCNAPSSGVHFGAITCEGCKGFFRRSIKERAPERYKCMDNGNCEISVSTRNMCRYCRFQKCLLAGMSAKSKNSRIGRQSNLFKHQIIEYQRRGCVPNSSYLISAQRKIKSQKHQNRGLVSIETDINAYNIRDDYLYSQQQQQQMLPQVQQDPYVQQKMNNTYNPMQSMQQQVAAFDTMQQYTQPQHNDLVLQQQQQQQLNHEFYYNPQPMDTSTQNIPKYDNSSYHQQTSHDIQQPNQQVLYQFQSQLEMIFDKHTIDYMKLITGAFLELKHGLVPHNEHLLQHHQLNEIEMNECIEHLRIYAIKFFKFCDNIPEMANLSMEDQNELIKNSIHAVMLLLIQSECSYLNYFNCDDLLFQKYAKSFPILYRACDFMQRLREQFEIYKLDDTEYALYAVLLILSGGPYLNRFDRINEMKERVAEILRKYLCTKRNEEITFDDLLLLNVNLRKFNIILKEGFYDAYQRHLRNDNNSNKPTRKSTNFIRAFLPTNFII